MATDPKRRILEHAVARQQAGDLDAAMAGFREVLALDPQDADALHLSGLILAERGDVFVIPDVLCNAGGVVVSYFEWVQDLQSFFWGETEVVDKLFRILETAYSQTLALSRKQKISMRMAALSLGVKRVYEAKEIRGLFP